MKDKDSERPSAHQLCVRVTDLKGMSKYIDSARAIQNKDEIIQSQIICIEENVRQLGRVNQQLEASEQLIAQFERRIAELEQQLGHREQQMSQASIRGKELTSFKLKWREGKKALCMMCRWCNAVVDGNTVYVRGGGSVKIYSYDVTNDRWSQLPDGVHVNGSITVVNGWLTTVGGGSYHTYSNELFSLTREGSVRKWAKKFPPMPTKRMWTSAVVTGTTLIVAGGWGEGGVLSTIEIMNTENRKWSTAADLPQPMSRASATVCGNQLYMLGGVSKVDVSIKSVYTCSVSDLLQSNVSNSLLAKFKRTNKVSIWSQIANLPVTQSTCESFDSRLLAIGGYELGKGITAVYMYDLSTNSWKVISHMINGRHDCFAAVLPDNLLMVVGGFTVGGSMTDTVEFASVCS